MIPELTEHNKQHSALGVPQSFFYKSVNDFGATGDGSTDDTAAIQAAIDSIPATGGTVIIPEGTYIVSRVNPGTTDYCILINKPIEFVLSQGATIKLAAGDLASTSQDCIIVQVNTSNATISGFGTIDGNRDNQTDTTMQSGTQFRAVLYVHGNYNNVHVRDVHITGGHFQGVHFNGTSGASRLSNVSLLGARITDCREGVSHHWTDVYRCSNNYVENFVDSEIQDGIESSHSTKGTISGNVVKNVGASAFDIGNVSRDITVTGNTAYNCGNGCSFGHNSGSSDVSGTALAGSTGSTLVTTGLTDDALVGFRARNTTDGSEGYVTANTTTTVTAILYGGTGNDWASGDSFDIELISSDITISNNVFDTMTSDNTSAIYCYPTNGADRVNITGNIVRNMSGIAGNGIYVRVGRGMVVSGNTIENAVGTAAAGIRVDSDDNILTDNYIYNTVSYGMRIDGSSNTVSGNKITKAVTAGIIVAGSDNFINGNNLSAETVDDNGTSNIAINNNVNVLDTAGATTPIHHDNVVAGTWTT